MPIFGQDVGWAGAYVPMVVGEGTLNELRNLAGPPSWPGQKDIEVDLDNGKFKWKTAARSYGGRRSYRRRRR
jgi:hypothetical protein